MTRLLARMYGGVVFVLAMFLALAIGTLGTVPIALIPRGRRERFALPAVALYTHLVLYGLLLVRSRVTGRVRLAPGRGALIICNHRSWLDPPLLARHTLANGLSKKEILYLPFLGIYAWLAGTVFFDRSSPRARLQARDEVLSQITHGNRLFIFPEGTRTRSGELGEKVRLRLVKDCYEAGIPVVPCAIYGSERTLPVGRIEAYPLQRVYLDIGEPLEPREHPDSASFAEAAWKQVTIRVDRLRQLGPS